MNRSGSNRVEKSSQKEALSILTQGFATIDEGIKFFDEVAKSKLTIVTEGYNTKFISKALELSEIDDVEVLKGIEGKSSKNQLKTLFEFFARMDHQKDVLFVFDCDVDYNLIATGRTHSFTFARNLQNRIATKGIENLFEESLFDGFTSTNVNPEGKETKNFHGPSKRRFEKFVIERNQRSDFINFVALLEKVRSLKQNPN